MATSRRRDSSSLVDVAVFWAARYVTTIFSDSKRRPKCRTTNPRPLTADHVDFRIFHSYISHAVHLFSSGWANSIAGQKLSVCLCVCVNQGHSPDISPGKSRTFPHPILTSWVSQPMGCLFRFSILLRARSSRTVQHNHFAIDVVSK